MRKTAASFALLGLTVLPCPALATWPDAGLVILDPLASAGAPSVYPQRGPNGDVYLLVIERSQVAAGYTVQRVLTTGDIAPGWGLDGVYLNTTSVEYFHMHALVPDAAGGVIHAGLFDRPNPDSIGVQYAQPGGTLQPYEFGDYNHWRIRPGTLGFTPVDAAPDGAGGAYVAWATSTARLQRRRADGSIEPGWSSFGRVIGPSGSFPGIDVEADGAGGAVVLWTNEGDRARALRFMSDTTIAPGWSATGLVLGANPPAILVSARRGLPQLLSSGPDHWIAVWLEPVSTMFRAVAQRFGIDGALDPAWPAAGLEVMAAADGIYGTAVISDGQGGIHMLWDLNGAAPHWAHVLSSGAFAPGHSSAGISPTDAGALYTTAGSYHMVGVPAPDGGLIFLWNDARAPAGIRARWLLANGTPDPSEPNEGRVIAVPTQYALRAALSDGAGGAYVVWQRSYDQYTHKLFMGWLSHGTPVAVPREPRRPAGGFSLRVPNPNPSRAGFDVRFALPDDEPARLQLFDVSGRMLRALEVRGHGEGTARFDRLGELRAGLYVVRLTHGPDMRTARVVIAP